MMPYTCAFAFEKETQAEKKISMMTIRTKHTETGAKAVAATLMWQPSGAASGSVYCLNSLPISIFGGRFWQGRAIESLRFSDNRQNQS
jgi:hypothetical protein